MYVEDKFDGIRAQLHRSRDRVEIFSRDLRRITGQFPELVEQARRFDQELIADGEIIAFDEGRRLTFFDLQKRLGRKDDTADLFAGAAADVPVAFVIFDLLWMNGRSLLKTPLRERREQLGTLILPPQFQRANVTPARSATEIEQIFQDARQRLNEGLMIKDAESFYLPGTRGMFWFKLKRELATLDVVVVAAELGHGKRNNVLSDYTFAVRDETTGELLPIGKAYSGLTDVEIAELTEHFKQNTIADHGRYRRVNPNVVLEVAFNSIQPSTRHASGLALRFPRIKAIRRDKNVDSIDTLQYARELARQSTNSPNSFGEERLTSSQNYSGVGDGLGEAASSVAGAVAWLRRNAGNPHFLYLFHLALPFGEALLHSLFSFSSYLRRICHEALELRRNRSLRLSGGYSGNWSNSRFRDQFLSFRQCFLSFVQCFLAGIQLRFPLSELLFSS